MSVPRVFISSTYYDLKQVRNNIGDFIRDLGYEPVMHEHSGVAYTQTKPLEQDCYNELSSCDIIVCIIGNHFGSKSIDNDFSITMNEIQTALKDKKKVYIFIANDVYIENRTYECNKETGNFKSAYTDDIKIHKFVLELKTNTKIHLIEPFETTNQIINILKLQFAGLFQNLLAQEASLTEAKTAYDLQESADIMRDLLNEFSKQKEDFFTQFNGTIFAINQSVSYILKKLNLEKINVFIRDMVALDDFMCAIGFKSDEIDDFDILDYRRKYIRYIDCKTQTLAIKSFMFDEKDKLRDIRGEKNIEKGIEWSEVMNDLESDDDDLPF